MQIAVMSTRSPAAAARVRSSKWVAQETKKEVLIRTEGGERLGPLGLIPSTVVNNAMGPRPWPEVPQMRRTRKTRPDNGSRGS